MKIFATLVASWIVISWGAVIADVMGRSDDHAFRVMACMKDKRKALDVSPEEAYLLCEKEAHR